MEEYKTQSESIAELATALSKAQSEIEGAAKDKNNPFFKAKYADLSSVWDACKTQLTKNGLAVIQTTEPNGGSVVIITTLAHSSGEWIRGKLAIKPVKDDPQSIGSAITYARRYALAAMVGVCPEDDDAEAAMARDGKPKSKITKEAVQAVVDSATIPPLDEEVFRSDVNDAVTVKELEAVKEKHKRQINLLKSTDPKKYAEVVEILSSRKLAIENDMAGTDFIDDSIPF